MTSLTLFELNNLVREVLRQTLDDSYWLCAELAEVRVAQNGHCYVEFIEKDEAGKGFVARARGTIWARQYHLLAPLFEHATGERLRAGLKVRVQVTVEFHELYGYALNVIDIDPSFTLGDMATRRREILAQLKADGIIDDNRQLALPTLVQRIAIVSSAAAAGYGDFCNQLQHNDYGLAFYPRLFPAVMQGSNVQESVLAALGAIADDAARWDVVVIIRGGGATSDLADFDSYPLAAAVAQMPLPVIVGIGHERDQTVLDFVAHTSVKTPTAAAAFLIDHGAGQLAALDVLRQRVTTAARTRLQTALLRLQRLGALLPHAFAAAGARHREALQQIALRLSTAAPARLLAARSRLSDLQLRITQMPGLIIRQHTFSLVSLRQRLAALDPRQLLRRGYSITYGPDGKLLRHADDIHPGDTITTRIIDATLTSTVNGRELHPAADPSTPPSA